MRARVARFTVAFQTLLLVGSLLVPALVAATEIATDLWIYQDGDTVTVTGIDFGAIEAVDVVTTDPEGTVVDSGTATTDDMGGFTYQFVLNVTVGGIYNVVATGQASGFTAATQFDPPVSVTTTTTLNPLGNVGVGGSVSLAGNLNWGTPALNNAVQSKNGRTIHLNTYASAACNGSGTLISNATTSGSSGADAASYAFSWTPASAGTYFVAAVFDGFTIGSGGDRDDYQASNSTATCRTVVVDGAPMVTSTTPANGATNVAVNANIVISFSEPVSSGPVLHTTSCTVSGYHTASYAVGPASTFTLTNITPAFATNETCTVTINAVSVTDQDSIDPPDAMAANYVFSFSTADAAPAVTSTTPANGATNVAVNSNIVVNFSESVSAGGAVSISCTSSGTHSGSLSASPSTSFTFNPTTDFVANETCTVTVDDNDVTDTDTQDPPNNMAADYLFSFSTPDGAPIVVSTNPASGATGVSQTPTIIVRFNEPVDLGSWYMLQCTSSGLHTGLIGGGPAIWSLSNITPQLSAAETCTFTVRAAEVTDQDANDPPDNLAADYVFQFQVLDIAPSVTTTTPLDDATDVALNASVVVTFSEPVTVDTSPSNWIDVTCNSVSQAGVTSGGGTTWAFDPTNDLPSNTTCSAQIKFQRVHDVDNVDPPDEMDNHYSFSFTTVDANTAPTVSVTGVSDGGSYEKGSVPAAGCSVVDAEDGNSTFAATLGAITGPDAATGVGSQTASCSYTDGGGVPTSASATYSITDGTGPEISYVLTPATPDGDNGWFLGPVTLDWTVNEGDSPSTLSLIGCVDQSLTDDQASTDYSCSAASAGGSAGPITVSIKIDGTAPVITDGGPTALANANGWYKVDVTNTFSVNADVSGPDAACEAAFPGGSQTKTTSGEGSALTVTSDGCTDMAGNAATGISSAAFEVDKTAPVISDDGPTTDANGNGWYNHDVINGFSLDAGISGPDAACEAAFPGGSQTKTTSGEGSALTVTSDGCTDLAGNSADGVESDPFAVDKTAPVISDGGATSDPNGAGWYSHDVTNTFNLDADISGPDAACAAAFPSNIQAKTTSGEGLALKATSDGCTDLAGNHADGIDSATFKVDKTAPVITDGGPTALANANGWYKADVTNTFSVNADVSGPDAACEAAFPGGSQFKTTSGEGTALTVTSDGCTDMAGNAATGISSAAFKVDLTAPTAVSFGVSSLSEGGVYYFGFVPAGPASCTANYDISGSSGCVVSGYSTAVGSHTVQAAATDQAGNVGYAEIHYTVNAWTITGFYSPVDMGGVLNTVKAGSTVPLKFEIFAGPMELTSTAYIKGFAAKEVACGALMWFAADDIEITSTGGTQLRYDSTGGQFIQNWATPRNKANTCWAVTMTTNDGSSLNAYFKLK